jgi:hypothetical protein
MKNFLKLNKGINNGYNVNYGFGKSGQLDGNNIFNCLIIYNS